MNYGSASSPVLFEDLVIINASVEGDAVIALEKRTGREIRLLLRSNRCLYCIGEK